MKKLIENQVQEQSVMTLERINVVVENHALKVFYKSLNVEMHLNNFTWKVVQLSAARFL